MMTRMTTQKRKHILVLLVLTAVSTSSAWAGHGRHGRGGMAGLFSQLDLSAEQKEKLTTLRKELKESAPKRRKALGAARKSLHEALAGSASDDDVRTKFNELHKLQEELARARFDHVLAVRSILTPAQRTKYKELLGERGERWRRWGRHRENKDEE